jgi:hypothetical protein
MNSTIFVGHNRSFPIQQHPADKLVSACNNGVYAATKLYTDYKVSMTLSRVRSKASQLCMS